MSCASAGSPSDESRAAVYYTALLINVGCHADAYEQARWCGDDITMKAKKYDYEQRSLTEMAMMLRLLGSGNPPLRRLRVAFDFALEGHKEVDGMLEAHARLARSLGQELGLPAAVLDSLASSYERWDGRGWPGHRAGEAIPIPARITQLAEFVEVGYRVGGLDGARSVATRRAGKQFDPNLVSVLSGDLEKVFQGLDEVGSWDVVIDAEPALAIRLSASGFDAALAAIARFVDLKSPFTLGHSIASAELARRAAEGLGLSSDAQTVHRAGLVCGFGRLGVSNAVWDKRGSLTAGEWERVRLHPHLTERMLHQSGTLAPLGRIAGQVRERIDGSGYPRGLAGTAITQPARVLAAADAYQAMREPRPHHPALSAEAAPVNCEGT